MLTYLFKRLLLLIPTFLGITLVTFFMVKLAPGDPASLKLAFREGIKSELLEAAGASREEVVLLPLGYTETLAKLPALLEKMGLWIGKNRVYYVRWLTQVVALDFGLSSKDHRAVLTRIGEALPI